MGRTATLLDSAYFLQGLASKQDKLTSGANIKTINSQSVLGGGDIAIDKAFVGLGNVDNTSDIDKPVSTAVQAALDAKQDTLASGINIKTINGQSVLGGGDLKTSNAKTISYLSKSGYNTQAIIVNGRLYTTSGNNGSYNNYTTGRGLNGQNPFYGVDNFKVVAIPSSSPIVKVGGFMHTYAFALLQSGELYTWGQNSNGQCGLGHTSAVATPTLAATGVFDAFSHPSQGEYSVNDSRLFILKSDGLYAAGYNAGGQLGIGSTTNATTFTKCTGLVNTSSTDIKKVFPIGASSGFTFVLTATNKIMFSGTNNTGVAGNGSTSDITTFTDVTSYWVTAGKTLVDIKVTGGSRYCDSGDSGPQPVAIMMLKYSDGTSEVKAAGYNAWGSLGDGTTTTRTTPVSPLNVPKDGSVIDIAGFGSSPLTVNALCSNGDLWSWGYNGQGQVGDGTTTNRTTPAKVQTGVTKLFSDGMTAHNYGYYVQSFIQKTDGLYACGLNDSGYCGIGNTTANITTHTKVLLPKDDSDIVDIGHYTTSGAGRIILALTSKNNLYGWGYNGQNGVTNSSTINCLVPVQVNLPEMN